jgi:hypothetical protein
LYNQEVDYVDGDWGCQAFEIDGLGTGNVTVRLSHNDVVIAEMTGFNGASLVTTGIANVDFDDYANTNQGGGATPTDEPLRRWRDNHVVKIGAPLPCYMLGLGTEAASSPGSQGSGAFTITDLFYDLFKLQRPHEPWASRHDAMAWARAH